MHAIGRVAVETRGAKLRLLNQNPHTDHTQAQLEVKGVIFLRINSITLKPQQRMYCSTSPHFSILHLVATLEGNEGIAGEVRSRF